MGVCPDPVRLGRAEILCHGEDGCAIALGSMVGRTIEAARVLAGEGRKLTVVNARFMKPLDEELVLTLVRRFGTVVTLEENVLHGGFGSAVAGLVEQSGTAGRVLRIGLPDRFVGQAPRKKLLEAEGLAGVGLVDRLRSSLCQAGV